MPCYTTPVANCCCRREITLDSRCYSLPPVTFRSVVGSTLQQNSTGGWHLYATSNLFFLVGSIASSAVGLQRCVCMGGLGSVEKKKRLNTVLDSLPFLPRWPDDSVLCHATRRDATPVATAAAAVKLDWIQGAAVYPLYIPLHVGGGTPTV